MVVLMKISRGSGNLLHSWPMKHDKARVSRKVVG